jgi:hypothetical protein
VARAAASSVCSTASSWWTRRTLSFDTCARVATSAGVNPARNNTWTSCRFNWESISP